MIRDPVCGLPLPGKKEQFKAEVRGRTYYFCGEYCRRSFLQGKKIAYFSMEIGLNNNIHTYSGGLGVLAGDVIKSSADLKIPLVGVTLVSTKGYLKQELKGGKQVDHSDDWTPSTLMNELSNSVEIKIQNRVVKVKSWLYDYQSPSGGFVSVLFLDTDVEGNSPEDREITSYLYGGDREYRLKQEIVLGIGGVKMLQAAGFRIGKYHMNEGHSSFLTLELLTNNGNDLDSVRDLCIFTTHTPVEAGHDKFSYDLVHDMLGDIISQDKLKTLGGEDQLNMTRLALNTSKYVNGVAKRHKEFSLTLFPGYKISAITNGVHSFTWTCECFRILFDKYLPGWANEPELLVRIDGIPDEEVWRAHIEAKTKLIRYIRELSGVQFDTNVLTLGFARRFTGYKRASLLFSNLKRLEEINSVGKLQVVYAGKAHPRDWMGKRLIEEIHEMKENLKGKMEIVFLENYSLEMASKLTSGVDVWLNTPIPPFEASGTSGMKAAHNGVINFSVLDGWWVEGCIEGVTGWAIGPSPKEEMEESERRRREITQLYDKLEYLIIPTYYRNKDDWIQLMKNSIGKVAYYFNSHRMMRRYASEAYL
ncbi:alpha-glucan family phosphorylase [Candidatus Bathyarchaeota archaeon]|nr:alpha-glucan family phosphorylase [Candidatus Bathyarchaeota archaeon]